MKALLAGLMAVGTVLAATAGADARPIKVVVKPGYPYFWHGHHYRYHWGSRYYNTRIRHCYRHHHHMVCTYRYR